VLSSEQPGTVAVQFKSGDTVSRFFLAYETLLERQRYGPVEFVAAGSAGVKLNANVMLHLINKHFLARAA
jgi:hypothetical protein